SYYVAPTSDISTLSLHDALPILLRYQPSVGPSLDSQITRYLSQPIVPTYLGFDPRLQFVHEADAIDALVATIKSPVRGPVNVAADRKSTRLNSSHSQISYAVFCL